MLKRSLVPLASEVATIQRTRATMTIIPMTFLKSKFSHSNFASQCLCS